MLLPLLLNNPGTPVVVVPPSVTTALAGVITPTNDAYSLKVDSEHLINLYRERMVAAPKRRALYKTPGLREWAQPSGGNGRVRGLFERNDHLFAAIDSTIYDIDSEGNIVASYAGLANDGAVVQMVGNTDTLGIASAGIFYAVHSGALSAPATPQGARSLAFLKNYFVILANGMRRIYFSPDGLTWAALDYETAEASANNMLALVVHNEELRVFGNRITQAFYVGSDPDTPFIPRDEAVVMNGVVAPASIAILDEMIYGLGSNKEGQGIVWRVDGYRPTPVSTRAVENAIRTYTRTDDAVAWAHQANGHNFYRLSFPTQNVTWEYDATENDWHQVGYWNARMGVYEAHRGFSAASAFGKLLVGDRANGKIYQMSPDFYDDDGDVIRWLWRTQHLSMSGRRVQYDELRLGAETGVGLAVSPTVRGYDPQVVMRYSNNGGRTWSNELTRSMGKLGEYDTQIYWNRLGTGRDRVFERFGTDPVKIVLLGDEITAKELAS